MKPESAEVREARKVARSVLSEIYDQHGFPDRPPEQAEIDVIAAMRLEALAEGRLNGPPFGELTLEYVARLRCEAQALRENTRA